MVDSTNPRVMADNIKILAAGGGGASVVANPEGAATDELEKLGIGDGIYSIPKEVNYSANEVSTGISWIDNKPIYKKSYYISNQITETKAFIDAALTSSAVSVIKTEIGSLKIGGNYNGALYLNGIIAASSLIRFGCDNTGLWVQGSSLPSPEADNPVSDLYFTVYYIKES